MAGPRSRVRPSGQVLALASLVAAIVFATIFQLRGASSAALLVQVTGGLVFGCVLVVLSEQVFRRATSDAASDLRYFCLAIAGAFLGMTFPFQPTSGTQFLIIAFGVVIIGGLGSLPGTVLAAVLIGLSDGIISVFFSPTLAKILATLLVALVLVFRPQGLFGARAA